MTCGLDLVAQGAFVRHEDAARTGDIMEIDLDAGEVTNLTRNKTCRASPFPPFMVELIAAGGLIEHTKKRLARTRRRATR